MILHLIKDTPANSSALNTCLRYARKQTDCILLSGNAVNCLLQAEVLAHLADYKIYVSQEDVAARGLTRFLKQIEQVNYNEFVALSLKYDKVISW